MSALPEPTRWSLVVAGRSPDDSRYEEAWRYLFATYRAVIERYFARHAPDAGTAVDWADEFMAAWVAGRLDPADPSKGGFRPYLFASLRNFRFRQYEKLGRLSRLKQALKRATPEATEDAEVAFERDYARHVLEKGLSRLRQYQERRQRKGDRCHYHDIVGRSYLHEGQRPSQADLAAEYGLTAKAVERQLDQARGKLREWISEELLQTVADEAELPGELGRILTHCRHVLS